MLYIIQNDTEVPAGNIVENFTVPCVVLHPYNGEQLPPVEDISALIILGGAMGANDDDKHPFLVEVKSLLRRVVEMNIPCLGICLGGQLLAAALGAKVVANRWEELGTLPVVLTAAGKADQLFTGIPPAFDTFQWHHDSFDIPPGGTLLAFSGDCPNQAFRVGSSAWGLQFHPEVTEQIIREWCSWDSSTAAKTEELVAEFSAGAAWYEAVARRLVENFIGIAGYSGENLS